MQIKCSKENLKKTLQAVQRAVAAKGILPVLSNVLFSNEDTSAGFLKVVGTDLEIGVESLLEADLEEDIHITVPARKLVEIVNEFPDEHILFDFSESESVFLKGEKVNFKLNTLAANDFPPLPQMNKDQLIEIDLQAFCQAVRQTTFATATDTAKSVLTGVNLQIKKNVLKLAATDGYRLAVREIPLKEDFEDTNVILPRRTLIELERLIKQDEQDTFFMSLTQNHVLFESSGKILTSRLIEGKYPDYNKILPKNFERKVWLKTQHFLQAVKRGAIMASEQTHIISFDLNTDLLEVRAGAELGQGHESMTIKMEGSALTISFNAYYLMDVLKIFAEDTSDIVLHLNGEIQPVVVQSPEHENYVCMLMPIKP